VALKAPNIFLTWTFDLIYGKSNARLCVQKWIFRFLKSLRSSQNICIFLIKKIYRNG
jgi:hypothetical protein